VRQFARGIVIHGCGNQLLELFHRDDLPISRYRRRKATGDAYAGLREAL
jgi:hypothetical protein